MSPKPLLVAAAAALMLCAPTLAQTLSGEEAREDLQALYTGLQDAHVDLYASTPRPVLDRAYDDLLASMTGPVETADLHLQLQQFTALIGHGHARVEGFDTAFYAHLENGGALFPLDFRIRDGAIVITGAPEGSGLQAGDEILSLNGEPNTLWLRRVTRHISAETPALAYSTLERTSPYAMWVEYGGLTFWQVEVDGPNGHRIVDVEAIDYATYAAQPLERTGPDLPGHEARMLSEDIAYLRPGPFFDPDAYSPAQAYAPEAVAAFVDFIDTSFETFIERGADTLILDLRQNPGGSNSFSDPVLQWIADEPFRFYSEFRLKVSAQTTASNAARLEGVEPGEAGISDTFAELFANARNGEIILFEQDYVQPHTSRFDGEVYALIDRTSYSNAVSVGAIIQDYGFGLIAGEATTDMASIYGAMEHFYLPNSGLQIGYPKAHIIRPNGDERLHPLTPDIELNAPLFDDGDAVLDQLVALIESEG